MRSGCTEETLHDLVEGEPHLPLFLGIIILFLRACMYCFLSCMFQIQMCRTAATGLMWFVAGCGSAGEPAVQEVEEEEATQTDRGKQTIAAAAAAAGNRDGGGSQPTHH